jgi:hypothetical protein
MPDFPRARRANDLLWAAHGEPPRPRPRPFGSNTVCCRLALPGLWARRSLAEHDFKLIPREDS